MTLRTPNYGNYGIFLIRGNAGFRSSTVALVLSPGWADLARENNHPELKTLPAARGAFSGGGPARSSLQRSWAQSGRRTNMYQ